MDAIRSVLAAVVLGSSLLSAAVIGGIDGAALTNDFNLQAEGNVGQDISYVAFCVVGETVEFDAASVVDAAGTYTFDMSVDGTAYTITFTVSGDTLTYTSSPAVDEVVLKAGQNQYLFAGSTGDTVNTAGTPVVDPTPNSSPCADGQVGVKYDGAFEADDGATNANGPPA
jgi:hypothetical protein